jgi:tetratricopeptide (TPR) repeat protein
MLAPMRSRTKSLLACLIGVALAVPAIAQQSGSVTQYPTCPDPPPKLSRAELEAAGASYHVGVEAYDNGDYRKALDNIKDSFRRDCSKLQLLEQLALIYAALGDRAEAIHALETYLQRNPKAADIDTVQNRIQNLRALMQQSATATATATTTTTATATATTTATVTATATAVPTATTTSTEEVRGHTAGPWVVVGVGVAAAIAGGVMIGIAQSNYVTQESGCLVQENGDWSCSPQALAIETTGQRMSTESSDIILRGAGIIIGAAGVAAIVGGIIWHFIEPTGPKKTSASLIPSIGPGYAGLAFGAKF